MTSELEAVRRRVAEVEAGWHRLVGAVGRVIVGQHEVVEGILVALLAEGHVLLEGVPGLGKTQMVRAVAAALDLEFRRIQFTPDLLPSDVTGTTVLYEDEAGRRAFRFEPGPVFTHVLLADEVNRATPKTQSALLEAMAERAVTTGRTTRPLDAPFFVLATQNPLEMEGTYPLPEAQLDRFAFKLRVRRPPPGELRRIVEQTTGPPQPAPEPVATRAEVLAWVDTARHCELPPDVLDLVVSLVETTHPDTGGAPTSVREHVRCGASPRAAQTLVRAAKVRAVCRGRFAVAPEDVLAFAHSVLRHRLLLRFEAEAEGVDVDTIIDDVVEVARARCGR